MARALPSMHKRPGSENWWLRVHVPQALREQFHEGRTKYRFSLGTTDTAVARALALAEHAKWSARFAAEAAQLKPVPQAHITPELADLLAQRARARILAADDSVRYDPSALRTFLRMFAPVPMRFLTTEADGSLPNVADEQATEGMTPGQLQALGRIHDALGLGLSQSLAFGQLATGETWAAAEAAKLGISADWKANRPAVLAVMRAVVGAWIEVGTRNLGAVVPTPALPEIPATVAASLTSNAAPALPGRTKGTKRTLWDVSDEWSAGRSRDAVGKMGRALRALEASGCPVVLEDLTRQHALAFRTYIRDTMKHTTAKTQSDVMANVQSLLNFAVKERAYLLANPWQGTAIAKGKATNRRTPWADEDLRQLFAAPLFSAYVLPEDVRAGGPAAYWLPLLALFGGLRIAELTQLRVADVHLRDGVTLLDVNEQDGKAVKSAAGVRTVPVHSRLIALGFADYVADMRDRDPAGLLFPALPVNPSRTQAEYASDSFRRLCQGVGVYQRWRDFHAFRTTVSSALRGVHPALDESLILGILGHEGSNVGQQSYTVHAPKALARAIEHLHYPAADALPRVYPTRNP